MSVLHDADRRRQADPNGEPPEVLARFLAHRDLAARLSSRYHRSANRDDLSQAAEIALLLAARRYDADQGPFERYAVVTIIGELKKHLRRTGWAVHVPRRAQEDALTVQNTIDALTVELSRSPLLSEVAERTGLTAERVSQAVRARSTRFVAVDTSPERSDPDPAVDDLIDHLELCAAVDRLDERDRLLVSLVFECDLTQRQIAQRIGLSQSQVQRRLTRVLDTLKLDLSTAELMVEPVRAQ